jgi:hypothetical protein
LTPQLDNLRFEGHALRLRLEHLIVAEQSVPALVGDVRAWQLDCLAVVEAQRPDRLADFHKEVGAIQQPSGDRSATAGTLTRLDRSIVNWLLVIDWLRLLD